ncbi:RsmE family RNA methyltransferase [Buchnera aphidicola]|uniref:RsmE family RNA methyltransferase n=1 Tax=Buchnera aphidicola TaxID=9 RepID=UPI0030EEF795
MKLKNKKISKFFINKKNIKINKIIKIKKNYHHIKNVLKLKKNKKINIFNNTNYYFIGIIKSLKKKIIKIIIKKKIYQNNESKIKIHLGQLICAKKKMDWIVQKSSELGITSITPILYKNSKKYFNNNKIFKRLKKISISSSEQCNRNKITKINLPTTLLKWINKKSKNNKNIKKIFCDFYKNYQNKTNIQKIITKNCEIMLLVGSEKGFCKEDLKLCKKKNFYQINLGNRILRVETASIVAISIIQCNKDKNLSKLYY